jgi:hypothetical protein
MNRQKIQMNNKMKCKKCNGETVDSVWYHHCINSDCLYNEEIEDEVKE